MLIHAGYVKTGSTALQRHLFRPERGFRSIMAHRQVRDELIMPAPLTYRGADLRTSVGRAVEQAESDGLEPVLTHERLAGNPMSGGYDSLILLDRLHELLPDARILLVVREQRDMARSAYRQYVREGGVGGLERYLRPPVAAKLPLFRREFLEYHRLVQAYADRFGEARVLVLPFELLRDAPDTFVGRITSFVGVDTVEAFPTRPVNRAASVLSTVIRAQTNRIFGRDNANPWALLGWPGVGTWVERLAWTPAPVARAIRRRWSRRIEDVFGDGFAPSNARLQSYVTEDLRVMGYAMPAEPPGSVRSGA